MKKLDIDNYFLIFTFIFYLLVISNSKLITENLLNTLKLFIYNIFPSLFPTILLGNILVRQRIDRLLPNTIINILKKTFNIDESIISLFITSIFTGSPSNAIYINDLLEKKLINNDIALRLLCSTHFVNPLFIISVIGIKVFNNAYVGILLWILLIIENLIKLYINKRYFIKNKFKNTNKESFIASITSSIKIAANSLTIILGSILAFSIIITVINNIFTFTPNISLIINGIFEMTTGILKLSTLEMPFIFKLLLSYFFINFGGLCIHIQTLSMLKNKEIRYFKYLISRIF